MEMTEFFFFFTRTPKLYPAFSDTLFHRLFWVTSRKRWQNWTPCSAMESRKAPWSWFAHTANVGMRTPFSSSLPPSLRSLWTTPKQEVHFLFFLKKGPRCLSSALKVTVRHTAPILSFSRSPFSPNKHKYIRSDTVKLYKDITACTCL